jgi:hypothetical protein
MVSNCDYWVGTETRTFYSKASRIRFESEVLSKYMKLSSAKWIGVVCSFSDRSLAWGQTVCDGWWRSWCDAVRLGLVFATWAVRLKWHREDWSPLYTEGGIVIGRSVTKFGPRFKPGTFAIRSGVVTCHQVISFRVTASWFVSLARKYLWVFLLSPLTTRSPVAVMHRLITLASLQ